MVDTWITTKELMEMARVSRQLVYAWRIRRKIRFRKTRRAGMARYEYRYPLSEVERLLSTESLEVAPVLRRTADQPRLGARQRMVSS